MKFSILVTLLMLVSSSFGQVTSPIYLTLDDAFSTWDATKQTAFQANIAAISGKLFKT